MRRVAGKSRAPHPTPCARNAQRKAPLGRPGRRIWMRLPGMPRWDDRWMRLAGQRHSTRLNPLAELEMDAVVTGQAGGHVQVDRGFRAKPAAPRRDVQPASVPRRRRRPRVGSGTKRRPAASGGQHRRRRPTARFERAARAGAAAPILEIT